MSKVVLDVPDIHLNTVMAVLRSLKSELVTNIEVDSSTAQPVMSSLKQSPKPYQGKQSEAQPVRRPSKYISPEEFKKRLSGKK